MRRGYQGWDHRGGLVGCVVVACFGGFFLSRQCLVFFVWHVVAWGGWKEAVDEEQHPPGSDAWV